MPKIKDEYYLLDNNIRKDKFIKNINYHSDPHEWENEAM